MSQPKTAKIPGKTVKEYESRKMSNFFSNRVVPFYDGQVVGFDYYLEPSFFVRFINVMEYDHRTNKLPLLDILGLDPQRTSYELYKEMIDSIVNRQRIVDGFRSSKESICLTTAQQQAFDEVVTSGRWMAEKVELYLWNERRNFAIQVQPADLDDKSYELFLDIAVENRIGYYINYKEDIDVFKEARFDFEVKLGELEMDPNFTRRQMKIKLFKRQYNMQVPIPIEHVRKKFGVATVVLIASLVVGAIGHGVMMAAPGVLGKVAGATLKAVGALGALLGRKGYKTLIDDFEDRPVILQSADNML